MDPGAMMNEGSFANGGANTGPYNLSDIWQFPMNVGAGLGDSGSGLGLRRPQFGHNLGPPPFGDYSNRDVPGNDQINSEQRGNNNNTNNHGVNNNRKRRDSDDEFTKGVSTSNGVNDGDEGKRLKVSANRNESRDNKAEAEPSSGKHAEQNNQPPPPEPPKQDYIHVRARRGQATDSHSLAERARREKISERMKILQDLVPGCNKVIGKALVLDEIINYIQSLQSQVEFLSMKLEAVNSRLNPGIEVFPPKDLGQQSFETDGLAFGSQATREYSRGSSPEWLHMQILPSVRAFGSCLSTSPLQICSPSRHRQPAPLRVATDLHRLRSNLRSPSMMVLNELRRHRIAAGLHLLRSDLRSPSPTAMDEPHHHHVAVDLHRLHSDLRSPSPTAMDEPHHHHVAVDLHCLHSDLRSPSPTTMDEPHC